MANKLNVDQRMLALRMYAEGHDSGMIKREIKSSFDIDISANALSQTCKSAKNQPHIKAFRERYLAEVKAVPIANKRYRIDDLERERVRLNKLIKETPTKTRADKTLYLSLIGELRRLIDTAREEMEKKPHLFQNVNVAMGDISDESIHKRKQELIRKLRGSVGGRITGVVPDPTGTGSEDS